MTEANTRKISTVAFCTLGCKVNQQETDSMRTLFETAGYRTVSFEDAAAEFIKAHPPMKQTRPPELNGDSGKSPANKDPKSMTYEELCKHFPQN